MIGIDSQVEPASCAVDLRSRDAHSLNDNGRGTVAPAAAAGVCILDQRGDVLAANPAGREWLGGVDHLERLRESIGLLLAGNFIAATSSRFADGVQLDRLDGASGPLVLVTVQQPESHAATVLDALTHLPDRRALSARADAWRRAAAPAVARFAALFLDLDEFKNVNDRHGHGIGDAVLRALAARWQHCIRDGDLLARYGGDEFVLLLQNATTAAEVEPVIRRLRDVTCVPISLGELTLHVSATVGWASSVDSVGELDATIAAADRDMYAGKARVVS